MRLPDDLLSHICHIHNIYIFFTQPATSLCYPLTLHDALPISVAGALCVAANVGAADDGAAAGAEACAGGVVGAVRSEEHTSELQSRGHLVCRLQHVKKKTTIDKIYKYAAILASYDRSQALLVA